MNNNPLYFFVAGEPSGDVLGAHLMKALQQLSNDSIEFSGIGGKSMEAEGFTSLFPMEELSIMGVFEVLPHVPRLMQRMKETARAIDAEKPAVVVTIDAPAFAHGVAKRIRDKTILHVHYVAPTVWAWRPWRVQKFKRHFDHLFALLPFEPPLFENSGLPCTFVGHPVVETGAENGNGSRFRRLHGITSEATVLCVLFGSRKGEVKQLATIFDATVKRIANRCPDLVVVAPTINNLASTIKELTVSWKTPTIIVEGPDEKYDAMAACNAALAASGTVSLELAMAEVPSVVTYRLPWPTYLVIKAMSNVRFVTLINIILDREVVPELLQNNCRPDKLCEVVLRLLDSGIHQVKASREALNRIGMDDEQPSKRAAKKLLSLVAENSEMAQNIN